MERKYLSYWTFNGINICLVIIAFSLTHSAFGQDASFIDEFLSGSFEIPRVKRYQDEMNFLEDDPIKSAWIREVEVRAKAKHYDESIDDYRFRVSPTNPWEIKANKGYQNQLKQISEINYSIAIGKELKRRYQILIGSYFQYQKLLLLDKELELKQLSINNDLTNKNIDPVDLIDLESALTELEVKKATSQLEYRETNTPILKESDKDLEWGEWKMISPEKILQLTTFRDSGGIQNIHKTLADSKLKLENQEYRINRSESFGNIGFLQANMDLDQGDTFNDHLGFQIGVSIPIVNKKKADLARDRFNLIETENDVIQKYEEVDFELNSINQRINSLYHLHDLILEKLRRSYLILERVQQDPSPVGILKIEQYQIDLNNQRNTAYEELLKAYIEYLDVSGTLAEDKNLNYLSPNLTSIH